jgi:YegS/Rv2252/BmrU family lipid kinase
MLYFIVNLRSKSGYAQVIWKKVKTVLKEQNVKYDVYFTEYEGHASKLAKNLTSKNEKIKLVVLGGDGTVNEVVNGMERFENVLFGYIPSGSSNDLARSLRLPSNPKQALLNIIKPKYFVHLDIGEVITNTQSRRFVVSSGIGFDASICREALDSKLKLLLNKIKLGKLTYVGIALKQIALFQTQGAEVVIDGNIKKKYKGIYFIASHIHKYEGGGLMLCPNAKYDDGKLDVCVIKKLNKLKLLCLLPTAFSGKHIKYEEVEIIRCNEIAVKTSKKLFVHTDGEIVGINSDITVKSIKEKLTIIAGNLLLFTQ